MLGSLKSVNAERCRQRVCKVSLRLLVRRFTAVLFSQLVFYGGRESRLTRECTAAFKTINKTKIDRVNNISLPVSYTLLRACYPHLAKSTSSISIPLAFLHPGSRACDLCGLYITHWTHVTLRRPCSDGCVFRWRWGHLCHPGSSPVAAHSSTMATGLTSTTGTGVSRT